jgi:arylsulfatase A-like enzyme
MLPFPASTWQAGGERPNILWLVSEDNGRFLGCYGDGFADTPHLDRLAEEGVLYENAFANAPVCAPARSTLITGMYACSLGTHHMRSNNPIPAQFKFFTQYLREAGYYCTNRAKEDYNTAKPDDAWDESSRQATWMNRDPAQPFFSVVNFGVSHESSLHDSTPTRHEPALVDLPPYHPDTPEFRHDWAQYYDRVAELDRQIGEALAELEAQGLAEDTIVFYYSDHAGVLPRSKRFLYDSGTHIPLIVRFPQKYRHFAAGAQGTRTERLVSHVDFAPSVLSLAGVPVPEHMQGRAFLGPQAAAPNDYIYLFRGRMDERYDLARAVRDKRFKYIRNYMPHRIYAQHLEYLWRMPAMQSWQRLYDAGQLRGPERYFFEEKPAEELFDTQADPHEVSNLAGQAEYQDVLLRMRQAERDWVTDIRDAGFLAEGEMVARSEGGAPYEMAHDRRRYDLDAILSAADIANSRDPDKLGLLVDLLSDEDSGLRFWGAVGCVALGPEAAGAREALLKRLQDPSPDVRIAAAESLCLLGDTGQALQTLGELLDHENEYIRLHAANALDNIDETARPLLNLLERKMDDGSREVRRVMNKAVADLGGSTRTRG